MENENVAVCIIYYLFSGPRPLPPPLFPMEYTIPPIDGHPKDLRLMGERLSLYKNN